MIPRLKPTLDYRELLALVLPPRADAVGRFEAAFADMLDTQHAIAFPYGRSALWVFFKAMGIEGAEIIVPAYTCSVVPHAVVLSDNIPRFVDINLTDYNMNLDQLQAAITPQTRAIVATHLFGYPMDIHALTRMVTEAEARYGHKIWVIQDCAHSFGASWQGQPVHTAGDAGLFGLNISKTMTAIFGGMLTTDDAQLAQQVRSWRNAHYHTPDLIKGLRRRLYLTAIYPAFNPILYGLVYWLQENTTALKGLTDAYHLDEKIHFPPDYQDQMMPIEAQVGLVQTRKYPGIIARRRETARHYCEGLAHLAEEDFVLPPLVEGATYSHYVIRVADRDAWVQALAKRGIQAGILIEYSMPEMTAYQPYRGDGDYPNARLCSQHMINLPIHTAVGIRERKHIIRSVQEQKKEGFA